MNDYRIVIEGPGSDDAADYVAEVQAEHASQIDMFPHLARVARAGTDSYRADVYRIERKSDCIAGFATVVRWRRADGVVGGCEYAQ